MPPTPTVNSVSTAPSTPDISDYARLYRLCTPAAGEARLRLVDEAEKTAADIHSRFAE